MDKYYGESISISYEDFFKLIHDVAKVRRAERKIKRQIRWAQFLSKTKWGKLYLLYKIGNRNQQ